MRPSISPVMDIQTQKNFAAIREALCGGLSFDNMNIRVLEGTTADTVDTQKMFQHSMNPRPISWFPLIGDVYVQEISNKFIDVRSTKPGVNFKIVLLGGSPVTGESLVAIGNDQYVPTFTESDLTSSQDIGFGTFSYLSAKGFDGAVTHFITSPGYFFLTKNMTSGLKNQLIRVDSSTGEMTALTVTAAGVPVGPLYFDGTYIWTTEKQTVANLYCINPETMTIVSTTALNTGIVLTNVADLIVDGDVTWILGSNGTWGSASPFLAKQVTSTGAQIGRVVPLSATADGYGACQLSSDENYIYYVNWINATGAIAFHKVAKSFTGAITATGAVWSYVTFGKDLQANTSVYKDGLVYTITISTAPVLEPADQLYSFSVLEYNTTTGAFSQYPLFSSNHNFLKATNGPLSIEVKLQGDYLYIVGTGDASIGGVCLNIFDTISKTSRPTIYPLFIDFDPTLSLFTVNARLAFDADTNDVILLNSSGRAATSTSPANLNLFFTYPNLNYPSSGFLFI